MLFQDKFFPRVLQYSFKEFYFKNFLCDVCLVVDKEEFNAHKLILSAASPYFSVMFNPDSTFIESKGDKVNLNGIEKAALSNILEFIYSSYIEINDENVYTLMEAANLLQIHSLRGFIDLFLQKSLSIKNCLHIFVMADLYQFHDLSAKAFYFLLKNFSKIITSDDFLDLPYEVFYKIVSSQFLNISSEEGLYEVICRWVEASFTERKDYFDLLISRVNVHLFSSEKLEKILLSPVISESFHEKVKDILKFNKEEGYEISYLNLKSKLSDPPVRHTTEEYVIFAIGGESNGMASRSAECFKLGYDKWKYVVPMCTVKRNLTEYTSALPPLRCARYYAASANNMYKVYVMGGMNSTSVLDECEVYNIKTNQWNYFPKLPKKLFASAADFLERKLIVVGGCTEEESGCTENVVDEVWEIDEVRNTWVPLPSLKSPRYFHCTVTVGGYIFAIGGYNNGHSKAIKTCEKFDPGCNRWFEVSSMLVARAKFGCGVVGNYIYVFGGTQDGNDCLNTVERYNVLTDEWNYEPSMSIARHSFSVAVCHHEIYLMGGTDYIHILDYVEKFNLRTKRWHYVHSMQNCRLAPTGAALLAPCFSDGPPKLKSLS